MLYNELNDYLNKVVIQNKLNKNSIENFFYNDVEIDVSASYSNDESVQGWTDEDDL